jgi:hypothetical protein
VVDYPRASEAELPELYETLDDQLDRAENVLRAEFRVRDAGEHDVVVFGAATAEQYLGALWADPEVMVPFFQKVSGLPDREFQRQYGVRNVGSRLRNRKTDFREEPEATTFAEALEEILPDELAVETLLYTFVTMWESDQRRHYRARYEETVLEYVRDRGFSAFKGNSLTGEPDLVVPDSPPYEVIGEIRVIQQKDKKKRFKEFGSEARVADREFPDAKFVVVANVGHYVTTVDREELRAEIHDEAAGPIDAVVFQDELEDLVERFDEWGISR